MKCKFERGGECKHPKAPHGACLFAEIMQEQEQEAVEAGAQIMQEKVLDILQKMMEANKDTTRAALRDAMEAINALEVPQHE